MNDTIQHYIGGREAEGTSGRYADVYNPALGQPCARVALASLEDVNAAVAAAHAAFPAWAATPPLARARVLFKYLQLC
jgi:malonate-semialdehyde dehydrogenase (acetylating)/methylmalonate-semialdehyde dehydrogenase